MKDLVWRKSSFCDSNGCAEVASLPEGNVMMRQSDLPELVLTFTPAEWKLFVAGVLNGEFDL